MLDPIISPDGQRVAFIYMSDIWEVPFLGGVARRLTSGTDNIWRPSYSPDGEWIYFQSDRSGSSKFYRIPISGGRAELITGEVFSFCDWFPDGQSVLVMRANPGEASLNRSLLKYDIHGKRPLEIVSIAGTFHSISPDGNKIVFDNRGDAFRLAYQGSANGDLWLYNIETGEFARLTDTPFTERYPVFSHTTEDRIYYVASDLENFQLYYMDNYDVSTQTQLTFFTDWPVRKIAIARQNDRIVFERFDEIWRYDPQTNTSEKLDIQILEDNKPFPIVHETVKSKLSSGVISDDGRLLVFSHKYDLFAKPLDGGEVRQLTFDQRGIDSIAIMSDNETIYFTANVRGIPRLFTVNIKRPSSIKQVKWSDDKFVSRLSKLTTGDIGVTFDVGSKMFQHARICKNGKIRNLISDEYTIIGEPIMTRDGKKLIYIVYDFPTRNTTLRIKDVKTQKNTDLLITTFGISNLMLCAQERTLFLRMRGTNDIYRVNLINEVPDDDRHWESIITGRKPHRNTRPLKNVTSLWDITPGNFNLRTQSIVSGPSSSWGLFTTPDSLLYYISGDDVLRRVQIDGSQNEEVFKLPGTVDYYRVNDDFTSMHFIAKDRLYRLDLVEKRAHPVTFEFSYSYDAVQLNRDIFEQVWGVFGHSFYDPDMHGLDWEQIFDMFSPHATQIYDTRILRRIVEEMKGRVNASHTGFTPRSEDTRYTASRHFIGATLDFSTRLPVGIKFRQVYLGSELSQKYQIKENDILLEVDGTVINADSEIEPLFFNKTIGNIALRIQTSTGIVNALVRPLSWSEQSQLRYDDLVWSRHHAVLAASGGRIGYLHIPNMGTGSLGKFTQDFLALNKGTDAMIIDVRGNTGGRISGQILDIITRTHRTYTRVRYQGPELYPFPANFYGNPLVVLIDEYSYSDAEIFGHLFRDLRLGTVIGMPTSGAVIGTSSVEFMDGSTMRMPRNGWFRLNMQNMENNGAQPDIFVPRLPHHYITNQDPQLDKAIEVLLKEMGL
jgi:C-terminal processing protease CtpA/Prc/Tol biopolymer transport system component